MEEGSVRYAKRKGNPHVCHTQLNVRHTCAHFATVWRWHRAVYKGARAGKKENTRALVAQREEEEREKGSQTPRAHTSAARPFCFPLLHPAVPQCRSPVVYNRRSTKR